MSFKNCFETKITKFMPKALYRLPVKSVTIQIMKAIWRD